jgi:predicted transcriptional regulator
MAQKRNFNTTRSAAYQHLLIETPQSQDMIVECSDSQFYSQSVNANLHAEEIHDLKDQLKEERWRLIMSQLTDRQKDVIKLWSKGKTQIQIAKILNVNQSSVTKSINGNVDYSSVKKDGKKSKRVYGGAKKKLRRLQATDEAIQNILEQLSELENNC